MKKSLYICNANTTQRVVEHTDNTAISVFPCGTSASRSCVVFAKLTKEIRSLFVHTKSKTCYTMRTPNKQAMKAKNSNLSQFVKTSIIGTIAAGGLILFIGGTSAIWNILGIVCIAVAGILNSRWNDTDDYSAYANEFVNYEE